MALIYQHRRLDTNEIFYVGISNNNKRPFNKLDRNNFWKHIVAKTNYKVEILVHKCSWEDAKKLEIYFIKKYKLRRDGGTLCNLTKGGEGTIGWKPTKATLLKMSLVAKGRILSEEHKNNIGKGQIGKKRSNICKDKISEANKRIWKESNDRYNSILKANGKGVLNIITNKVFKSCKLAAKSVNMNYSTLRAQLNGTNPNTSNFKYI